MGPFELPIQLNNRIPFPFSTAINMDCSESFPCFGCCDSGKGVKANNELALILRCCKRCFDGIAIKKK